MVEHAAELGAPNSAALPWQLVWCGYANQQDQMTCACRYLQALGVHSAAWSIMSLKDHDSKAPLQQLPGALQPCIAHHSLISNKHPCITSTRSRRLMIADAPNTVWD